MDLNEMTDVRNPVPTPGVPRLPNIYALTSVRFFAALYVALYHMVRPFSLWGPLADVMAAGYLGVSFFFVLSGFILTYSHAAEYESGMGDRGRFWVARLARVYPVYLLSMLFSAYVTRSQFRPLWHAIAFAADLLMVQSWSMRMVNFFNVPAWSLSTEAFFYLTFPFLLLLIRPSTRLRGWAWVFGMWVLAMAAPLYSAIHYPLASFSESAPVSAVGSEFVYHVRKIPLFALPEFLAGVSLGWIYLRFRPSKQMLFCMAMAGVVALMGALAFVGRLPLIMLHNGLLIPVYVLLILGLCGGHWLSRLLENKVMVLLGEASFALYLTHFLFNDWLTQQFGVKTDLQAVVWKLAIVIPVSMLLNLYVERPGRTLILTIWKKWRMAAAI